MDTTKTTPGESCIFPGLLQKKYLLVFWLIFTAGSFSFGQKYTYTFRIGEVNNEPEAKDALRLIRPLFNTEDAPFAVFPRFSPDSETFDFQCDLFVKEEELQAVLQEHQYTVISFKRTEPQHVIHQNQEK